MLGSWKYIFELASKDLELLKRKKQALSELLSSNKISQQTFDCLDKEISEAQKDVEKYMETITCRMKDRLSELEKQVGILEIFLANVEILHAAGEIDDEAYERQSKALLMGLESMKNEINEIKSALESVVTPKPAEPAECVCAEEAKAPPETSAEEASTEEKPAEEALRVS